MQPHGIFKSFIASATPLFDGKGTFTSFSPIKAALGLSLLLGIATLSTPIHAQTFTFEELPTSGSAAFETGALTSLTSTQGGVILTLTRPGSAFDLVDLSGFGVPASLGRRTLSPFFAPTSNTPFVANFSSTLGFASIEYGDGGDDSDTFTLQAFSGLNGTGTLLATATDNYGLKNIVTDGTNTLGVTAAGFRSLVFIGGSPSFPNSLYLDNLTVRPFAPNAVPEPSQTAALSLGLFGLSGLMLKARKRKATAA